MLTASSVMANTSDVTRVSAAITTAVHARGLPRRLVRRCTMPAIRAMRASGALMNGNGARKSMHAAAVMRAQTASPLMPGRPGDGVD